MNGKKKENLITFQFKSNQTISLHNGQSMGSAVNRHESEVYYCAPITCLMFIHWKINFKMMQLGTQSPSLVHVIQVLLLHVIFILPSTVNIDPRALFTSLTAQSGHVQIDFAFEYTFNGFRARLDGKSRWYQFMAFHSGVASSDRRSLFCVVIYCRGKFFLKMHRKWILILNGHI